MTKLLLDFLGFFGNNYFDGYSGEEGFIRKIHSG